MRARRWAAPTAAARSTTPYGWWELTNREVNVQHRDGLVIAAPPTARGRGDAPVACVRPVHPGATRHPNRTSRELIGDPGRTQRGAPHLSVNSVKCSWSLTRWAPYTPG